MFRSQCFVQYFRSQLFCSFQIVNLLNMQNGKVLFLSLLSAAVLPVFSALFWSRCHLNDFFSWIILIASQFLSFPLRTLRVQSERTSSPLVWVCHEVCFGGSLRNRLAVPPDWLFGRQDAVVVDIRIFGVGNIHSGLLKRFGWLRWSVRIWLSF